MMHAVFLELQSELKARGVPAELVHGPSRIQLRPGSIRIVLERDRQSGDQVIGPRSDQRNPRLINVRAIGFVIRVFAQSTKAGACTYDHEDVADNVVDCILASMRVVTAKAKTMMRWTSSKMLSQQDLSAFGIESWPGVAYELCGQIDRGVFDLQYRREPAAEAAWSAIGHSNTTDVSGPGASTSLPTSTSRVDD